MRVLKDGVLRESAILFVLNMLASVLNYVCQLLIARVLSVDCFGTINAIFSFMLIVSVPGTTLTMIIAKYYAGLQPESSVEKNTGFIIKIIRYVSIGSLLLFVLFALAMKPMAHILVITDNVVLFFAFALGAMGFYQPVYSGVFSGNRQFVLVGFYSLLIPLYKLVSIAVAKVLFEDDQLRLYTVLLSMVIGTVLTAAIGHWRTIKILGKFSIKEKLEFKVKLSTEDINTFILNVCLMVYMNIDLLAVRYYGGEEESGLYSSVLLFGRVIYYFSTTLGTILLPLAASEKGRKAGQRKLFNKMMGLMMIFTVCCILPFNIGGGFLIKLLYGNSYSGAQQYIKYVSLISTVVSICTILVNYLVGVGKTRFATAAMAVINVLILLLVVMENRVEYILLEIGIIGMVGAVVIYLVSIFIQEKDGRTVGGI